MPRHKGTPPRRPHDLPMTLLPRLKTVCLACLLMALLGVCVGLMPAAVSAAPATKPIERVSASKPADRLDITLGQTEVLAFDGAVADILVADPDVVEIGPSREGQIYLIGATLGTTTVTLFDTEGTLLHQLSVHVRADTSRLEDALADELAGQAVSVRAIGNQIILEGRVANADMAARARDVAQRFAADNQTVVNNLAIEGGQQVMLKVKVVEVSRSILNELGIETDISRSRLTGNDLRGSFSTANSMGLTVDPSFGVGTLVYNNNGIGPIELMIRALERDGLVNTLAEPNLTAISGENARFLAGGEIPIPSQRDRDGNVVYEYRPFGVSLSFRPVVLDKNRINLQVSTEVSEVSTQTFQLPGVTVPSFSVRRAETTVELASGGSLMIAGMIQAQAIQRMNKLPGIGSVPVLGALASSESFTRNETELLVMITAYTVEPFAARAASRSTDSVRRTEPLNLALAEQMARTFGDTVRTDTHAPSFGLFWSKP